jgi:hypothetical protein
MNMLDACFGRHQGTIKTPMAIGECDSVKIRWSCNRKASPLGLGISQALGGDVVDHVAQDITKVWVIGHLVRGYGFITMFPVTHETKAGVGPANVTY